MNKTKIEVFTSPTCPHCPGAVKLAKEVAKDREDVYVEELSTVSPEGKKKAMQFRISSVPTVFVRGPATNDVLAFAGTPSMDKLNELIDISQGKKEIEEQKGGFFDKIWGKIKELD